MRTRAAGAVLLLALAFVGAGCEFEENPVVPPPPPLPADKLAGPPAGGSTEPAVPPALRELAAAVRPAASAPAAAPASAPAAAPAPASAPESAASAFAAEVQAGRCLFDSDCAPRAAAAVPVAARAIETPRPAVRYTRLEPKRFTLAMAPPPAPSRSTPRQLLARFRQVIAQYASGRRPEMDEVIRQSRQKGIDPALGLAVAMQETHLGQIKVDSPAGAVGLMQVMPSTARGDFGERSVSRLRQLSRNVDIGLEYLKRQWQSFAGSGIHSVNPFDPMHVRRIACAGSAYNAGPGRVERYGCDVPFRETREYVHNVVVYAQLFKQYLTSREVPDLASR